MLFTKRAPKAIGALACMAFFAYGQPINISGTVKDASANPITGATVTLVKAGKTATTDASGAYSITGNLTLANPSTAKQLIARPGLCGTMLRFGVLDASENVRISVYNLCGRRISTLADKALAQGNYEISLLSANLSSQFYFVKVNIGDRTSMFRMPVAGKTTRAAQGLRRINNVSSLALAKTAATVDTLFAAASGYKIGRLEIDNYIGTYNFILDKANFGLASPADSAMMCDSRKVTLAWNALTGAVKYEVWLNISRTDYDWMATGSLLDRYTKVAEVTGTTYTTDSLPDRWTYKWYIIAVDGAGAKSKSDVRVFSVYLPVLPSQADWADGIALLTKNGYQCRDLNKNGVVDPYEDWHNKISVRVADLMSKMTLADKAYQMFYNGLNSPMAGWQMGMMSNDDLRKCQINASKTPLGIPNITSGDHIHGYKNVFPAGIGLAASRDPSWAYKCGELQRQDELICGARGTLGPVAEAGTDILYYRIQEGVGENAEYAAALMRAEHCGYNDGPELNPRSIITTTKHFPGQGAGGEDLITFDSVTIKYHMKPWYGAYEAGMAQVMGGYAACPFLGVTDSGKTGYLHTKIGDEILACCDWSGSDPGLALRGWDVLGGADPGSGAGIDGFSTLVGDARISKSCKRILTVKFKMGMFENPYPIAKTDNDCNSMWKQPWKVKLCEDAAKATLTLLKNNNAVLPLKLAAGDKVCIAGPRKNDKDSYKEWSSWIDAEFGLSTIQSGIQTRCTAGGITAYVDDAVHADAKVAIVAVGEPGYQHASTWPLEQDYIEASQIALLKSFHDANIPVVAVYIIPRPYVITTEDPYCDAIVLAYRPGMGIGNALAGLLWGDVTPKGRLPWQLPKSMDQVGTQAAPKQKEDLPYDVGATDAQRLLLRDYINRGIITNTIFGDSLWGDPAYQYGFGKQTF